MSALDSTAVSVLVLLGLLLTSAFFSSTEIAVFSLSTEWLDERVAAVGGDPDIEEPYTDDDTAKERSDTPANDGP